MSRSAVKSATGCTSRVGDGAGGGYWFAGWLERHCEERSDEAIHLSFRSAMDCFRLRSLSHGGQVASLAMTARRKPSRLPMLRIDRDRSRRGAVLDAEF